MHLPLALYRMRWWISLLVVLLIVGGFYLWLLSFRSSQWDQAREAFKLANYTKVVELVGKQPLPASKSDQVILGQSYLALGQLDQALPLFSTLADTGSDLDAKLYQANILREQKKTREAEQKYQEIIQQNPNYIQAYLNLASLYHTANQLELANSTLTDGIKYNSSASAIIDYWLDLNQAQKGSADYQMWESRAKALNPSSNLTPSPSS